MNIANQTPPEQKVRSYYNRLGTRLGYNLIMRSSQHFGLYDNKTKDEPQAQINFHKNLSEILNLKPGMLLLDAGCGQGVVACYLGKNYGVAVEGITIVPREANRANSRAIKVGIAEKVKFRVADYTSPPFEPETFDRIYTTETLSHAYDLPKTLKSFYDCLKPRGKIVCVEYEIDYKNLSEKDAKTYNFWQSTGSLNGLRDFDRGNFMRLIKATGFKEVTEQDLSKRVMPSFRRIYQLGWPFDKIATFFHIEKYFVNAVAAKGYYLCVKHGVFKYKIYTATKPKARV